MTAPIAATPRLDRRVVLLLALTAGLGVANTYYVQPLLYLIGDALDVGSATAGALVALAQAGYAAGLAFVVPLGDLVERRALLTRVMVGTALAALACAAAPSFPVLAAAMVALGVLAVVAQIAVPLASDLAAEHERGQVVGIVMSGLLAGILSARTVSGVLAELGGWRLVYGVAAVALLLLAVALRRMLPEAPPRAPVPYRAALRSVVRLAADEPVLRQRAAIGFFNMAAFSVLWTSIVYLLGGPVYGYGEGLIGAFAVAGLAGIAMAPVAGRLADRGRGAIAVTGSLIVMLGSWGVLALGGAGGATGVLLLVAGLIVFDLGAQGVQINNQSAIYLLRPEARSRVTTVYMTTFFLGGVCGSGLAAWLHAAAPGWGTACAAGAGCSAVALAIWAGTRRLPVPVPARAD